MGPTTTDMSAQLEAYLESQHEIYHTPVFLGIKHFKRELAINFPDMKKSVRSGLIAAYKKRSWMEFLGISKNRGTFPTHPTYGKKVKLTKGTGLDSAEFEIKVKNGNKK